MPKWIVPAEMICEADDYKTLAEMIPFAVQHVNDYFSSEIQIRVAGNPRLYVEPPDPQNQDWRRAFQDTVLCLNRITDPDDQKRYAEDIKRSFMARERSGSHTQEGYGEMAAVIEWEAAQRRAASGIILTHDSGRPLVQSEINPETY